MPSITVDFTEPLNASVQIGDILYYVNPANENMAGDHESSGTQTPIPNSNAIVEVGAITSVNYNDFQVIADIENSTALPDSNSFFFFGKDNRANMSSLLGYYAEVKISNRSHFPAELFSIGSEVAPSSK